MKSDCKTEEATKVGKASKVEIFNDCARGGIIAAELYKCRRL
jgi:hypothetical protein